MVIEYDPTTLAPLGMVVSKDELLGRKVARVWVGVSVRARFGVRVRVSMVVSKDELLGRKVAQPDPQPNLTL